MSNTINLDQFYTHPHEVEKCLKLFNKHFSFDQFEKIIEPAAGAGAFFNKLPLDKRVGWDLEPRADGITKLDFIHDVIPFINSNNIAVITNPPFGRKGSLAFKFIERATTFANTICIILPKIFAKENYIKRWNKYFHLIDSIDVNSFVSPEGDTHNVRCVFQLWQKKDVIRTDRMPLQYHADFEMKHIHMSRVSEQDKIKVFTDYPYAVGQVSCKFNDNSSTITKGSHWFIKPNVEGVVEVFKTIDFANLDDNFTTHKSLSKSEIIEAYVNKRK